MTTEDLMKLADAYAETMYLRQDRYKARQALLDALEALGREVAELKSTAEADGHAIAWATQQVELIIKERDQARAELAAIHAQEPVGHFLKDFAQQGYWQQCKAELEGMTTPLYASPAGKDAGLVADDLAKDAARYRWWAGIIESGELEILEKAFAVIGDAEGTTKEIIDAAIDAAMGITGEPK